MKAKCDAYGHEIMSYLEGNKVNEIVERDDGHIDPSTTLPKGYFSEYKKWGNHEKKALKYVKGRVLDVGCGPGRHSLFLQQKGFDVTGIDNSPLAVKASKMRGVKKIKNLPLTKVDRLKEKFDTVLMLGNNFGLFGSYNGAKRLLKKLHKVTSYDAIIIAESTDPYKTKDPIHLKYHRFNRKRGRMSGQVRIRVIHGKYIGGWFDYLLASKKEMKDILKDTGWKIKKTIDSKKAQYIAVIEKERI